MFSNSFLFADSFCIAEVARPRNDLMSAVQSTNSTPTTTWDAAFKVSTGGAFTGVTISFDLKSNRADLENKCSVC